MELELTFFPPLSVYLLVSECGHVVPHPQSLTWQFCGSASKLECSVVLETKQHLVMMIGNDMQLPSSVKFN